MVIGLEKGDKKTANHWQYVHVKLGGKIRSLGPQKKKEAPKGKPLKKRPMGKILSWGV